MKILRPEENGSYYADNIFKYVTWMNFFLFRLIFYWSLFLKLALVEMHGYIISIVATDVSLLNHQTNSTHSADLVFYCSTQNAYNIQRCTLVR